MTFLNQPIESPHASMVLLDAHSGPNIRTRRRLAFWGNMLVVSHVIFQLALRYPPALGNLIPELWWNLLAGGSIELILLAILIPVLLERDGLSLTDIGFAPTQWKRDIRWGILAGAGIWLIHRSLLSLAMAWTGGLNVNTGMVSIVEPMMNGSAELLGVILSVVVLGPITEEVLYRGCLMASTRSCLGARPWTAVMAVIASGFVFAVVHAVGHPLYSVVYFVTGLAFALVYWKTGSLAVSVIAHGSVNALSALYICFQIYRG